jgi:hypothetical protein
LFSQKSEYLIPKDAITVLSINNMSVFQKVSLDELISYDFMIDIEQELFDGSTTGKSIKDAGIDFNQKLNIFYGRTFEYEISGFTFGIEDKEKLFAVFDDFEKKENPYPNVERYSSYFNQLVIKDKSALLIRIEPSYDKINDLTDSIWYARDNGYPWGSYDDDYMINNVEEDILEVEAEEIKNEDEIYEDSIYVETEPIFEEARDILSGKTYWELRDSISFSLQIYFLKEVGNELFSKNESLMSNDIRFSNQLKSLADGVFYLDNSRNIEKNQSFWYLKTIFPNWSKELTDLYSGNVILGDIFLNEKNIEFKLTATYGEKLGSIYQNMNDSKFDKNITKYIHRDNSAFFTYNINLKNAYEQTYDIIVPMLENEENNDLAVSLLILELFDEYINKDALFGSYKGSMFGSFNGIKKIKTKKIIFDYDEDTWEYTEKEVEAEEDMPIFTFGITTDRADIFEKILDRFCKITSKFEKTNNYWVYHEAILGTASLYFINKNGLLIITDDEDLAVNNSDGYGVNSLNSKKVKEIKSNGFMYVEIDWNKTIDRLPRDIFSGEQNELIDAMRNRGGTLKLTSSKTTNSNTKFDAVYSFEGNYDNSGKYILDFVNSIYLISK